MGPGRFGCPTSLRPLVPWLGNSDKQVGSRGLAWMLTPVPVRASPGVGTALLRPQPPPSMPSVGPGVSEVPATSMCSAALGRWLWLPALALQWEHWLGGQQLEAGTWQPGARQGAGCLACRVRGWPRGTQEGLEAMGNPGSSLPPSCDPVLEPGHWKVPALPGDREWVCSLRHGFDGIIFTIKWTHGFLFCPMRDQDGEKGVKKGPSLVQRLEEGAEGSVSHGLHGDGATLQGLTQEGWQARCVTQGVSRAGEALPEMGVSRLSDPGLPFPEALHTNCIAVPLVLCELCQAT